jgi:PD-(D/E)XK endonuclease
VNWENSPSPTKAASLGFGIAKPLVDSERYDFILDSGERFWRVQVKSTCQAHSSGYPAWARGSHHKPYKASEIDFLVAYIIPRDIWYVIPVNLVTAATWLGFYPSGCKTNAGRFESYREAWQDHPHTAASLRDLRRPMLDPSQNCPVVFCYDLARF